MLPSSPGSDGVDARVVSASDGDAAGVDSSAEEGCDGDPAGCGCPVAVRLAAGPQAQAGGEGFFEEAGRDQAGDGGGVVGEFVEDIGVGRVLGHGQRVDAVDGELHAWAARHALRDRCALGDAAVAVLGSDAVAGVEVRALGCRADAAGGQERHQLLAAGRERTGKSAIHRPEFSA
ncbi:hypothetical protein [Streptomyces sp. NPDC086182]|jgi:hypothetical protein|uniref:hypothetical protein n=1 Tax=Streptomyces sp. NPDC086182 TaxID=3155058 RepID=UPI0034332480